ncbi:MAG TPA: matrixin family metalloprotease [Bdellovibrionales bacterium]|nr:matrixin family metalloprotease [Bdellovibrionales bacterium]
MLKIRAALPLLFLTLSVLLTQACSRAVEPQASCNFVQNPEQQRVSWERSLPVKLYLHDSVPADAFDAIDRAVAEYNLRAGGGKEIFKIVARGVGGSSEPSKDGYSMLYFMKTWETDRQSEQARTTIHWTGSQIFEADMRINAQNFTYHYGENTDILGVDLDSLVVHELGHMLGLAHNVTSGSVMNFTLGEGQDRRKLGDVDLASLKCEY